jgi:hypothetical protein
MQRFSVGARHLGQFFGFAEDAHGLLRDPLTERRESNHAPRSLDQRHSEKRLKLAQTRGQSRLSDEAGFGGFAEVAGFTERDQILKLLDGGEVCGHRNRKIQSAELL